METERSSVSLRIRFNQMPYSDSHSSRNRGNRPRAFTLMELLVVVGIISLLLALVLVGFRKARLMARSASCLSNQRQISLAQASYATDNGGAYASNRTSPDGNFNYTITNSCGTFPILINKGNTNPDSYHSWTASYGTNMIGTREKEEALTKGRLFPYVGGVQVYKSHLDPTTRFRSYSLNSFVGGTVPEDSNEWANKFHTWFCSQGVTPREWISTHVAHHKFPSQTILSLAEDDSDGFNFNNQGWIIDPRPPLGSIAPAGTPNPGAWANSAGWEAGLTGLPSGNRPTLHTAMSTDRPSRTRSQTRHSFPRSRVLRARGSGIDTHNQPTIFNLDHGVETGRIFAIGSFRV